MYIDVTKQIRALEELHPVLLRACVEWQSRCKAAGLNVLVTETYRHPSRSDWLYEQGRGKSGSIVSNARGGYSIHNYRMAFDFCRNKKGFEFDNQDTFFNRAGAIWIEMGGVWGGQWTDFRDMPHCEYTNGKPLSWFKNGNALQESHKMKWEE